MGHEAGGRRRTESTVRITSSNQLEESSAGGIQMSDGQPNPERKNASSVTTHLRDSSTNHLPQTPAQSPLAHSVARLWHDEENPPDIIRFLLSQDPSLPAEELLGACLVDQRESWSRGVGRLAELYWNFLKVRCSDLKTNVLWELVESEWQLRSEFPESGRLPLVAKFKSRFPSSKLKKKIEVVMKKSFWKKFLKNKNK